jgi:hypothetical protein
MMQASKASYNGLAEKLLLILLMFHLFVDMVDGWLDFNGINFPLSSIYKLILILVAIFIVLNQGSKESFFILVILLCCFALYILIGATRFSLEYLMKDLIALLKLLSFFMFYWVFKRFRNINPIHYIALLSLLSLLVIFLNTGMSYVGWGQYSYGSFGGKGYFYSANAISGAVIIFSSLLFLVAVNSKVIYILTVSVCILISMLLGTKSAIVSVLVLTFLVPYIFKRRRLYWFLFISLLLFIGLLFIIKLDDISNLGVVQRILFFYDTGGFSKVIFSGRDQFFINNFDFFWNGDTINILLGVGHEGAYGFEKPLIEMDYFDLLILYGFLFLILYIVLSIFLVSDLLRRSKLYDKYERRLLRMVIFLSFLFLCMAGLSGHVIFSGITTVFWALVLAIPSWKMNYRLKHEKCV